MRDATTKQRLAALRRKLATLASVPRWMRQARERRLARLEAALESALPLEPGMASDAEWPPVRERGSAKPES
jgi:hypothetical protein